MEYYSELGLTNGHHSDSYVSEYSPQYMVPSPNAEYAIRNSILVDGGDRFGVSAVVFDKYEELIWMGNQGGHVTSYYGPNMQKYTSFQIHESEEVRDIITLEHGIYCLTKSTLRHQIRRGIPKFTHRSNNMTDMQCLFEVSPTKLFLGGHQDTLIELDLSAMVESVIPIEEAGCAVLRSGGGSVVACGSASGMVSLRDIRAPMIAQHTFSAHTACLSDLDMQGNLLITCGFTESEHGGAVPEQYVLVWDIRSGRGGPRSLQPPAPALLLHFLPAFSGRAVAVSGDGHVALLNINSQELSTSDFQVDTHNSQCSVMDVSSTSQALVFGDQAGHLHLFSPQHNHEPVFNNFSRETEFATPVEGLPFVSFTDTKFQYSSVPLSRLATNNKWFNELPSEFFKKAYRKPKPIDPEVLKSMKMQGPIGYAPNPRTHRRNQMPYLEENLDELNLPKLNDKKYVAPPIPNEYRKNVASVLKDSSSEELNTCNNTGLPGLESSLPNSYCNAMLQVLYYTPAVKATLLAHTCAKEFCLSCELGFLFRTLSSSGGDGCAANKFLRSFRTVPEAAALGLILPDRPTDTTLDLTALIQSWNRFILHQMHYEILESRKKELAMFSKNPSSPPQRSVYMSKVARNIIPQMNGHYNEDFQYTDLEFLGPSTEIDQECEINMNRESWQYQPLTEGKGQTESGELNHRQDESEETEISKLFAIGRTQLNRCLKCNKEEERSSVVLACALQAGGAGEEGAAELVRGALAPRRATPAWCDHCARFTHTTQRSSILRLPPILAINCGSVTAHEKSFWTKGSQKEMLDGLKRSGKPCRYGLHCARPGCRFKHPDRPSSSGCPRQSMESQCALPLQLLIRLQADGDVTIIDKADPNNSEPTTPVRGDKNKKKPSTLQEKEYNLSAAVISVEDNPRNLVAYIQTGHKDGEPQWHLFNDLRVTPVSVSEVCSLTPWWKSPCVLFYTSSVAAKFITNEPTAS